MVGVGNRLADLRRSRGLSQEEVAAGLGVSRQAVSNWERGEAAPDLDNLVALADCYSMTLDELVGRSSPVRTAPSARTADTESLLREEPPRDRFSTLKNGLIGLAAVLVPFAILLGLALKGGAWSTWALVIGGATGTVLLGRALYLGLSSLREGIARAWHELLDALR